LIHVIKHKVAFLWLLHRVHHADLNLNASSTFRFHPFEGVLTQGVFFTMWIPLFGISIASFVIFGTIDLVFVVLYHSNVKFPDWLEKYGRLIFVTPGWHK